MFFEDAAMAGSAEILIVDDFKEWRRRLRQFLEMVPGLRVVAEAENGLEGIQKAAQCLPDIVLLDIGLPLINGIEAAPRIQRASPKSKVIFLTQEDDSDVRAAALATGAVGYLLKTTSARELQSTIERAIVQGSGPTSPMPPRRSDYDSRDLEALAVQHQGS